MLVDTHCHLGDAAFDADRTEVVLRSREAGVGHLVIIGESREAADRALQLVGADARLSASAGVHPHVATTWDRDTAAWMRERLADPRVVAAGEMGLDYHYDHSPRQVQGDVFAEQLELAAAAGKPAIIHAREADDDVAAVITAHPATRVVLHSFSSGLALLRAALALDCYVSFSGMITFRSWTLDDAIRETPHDRILVETDAPYLAPAPHRGRRNEPALVSRVAERVAGVLGLPVDEVAALTTANASRLFGSRLASTVERP